MLFDPKWEIKTKEPSLIGFVAWLETKDRSEKYQWFDCRGLCATDQYLTSLGYTECDSNRLWETPVVKQLNSISYPSSTFGELLGRARAALMTD